MPSPLLLFWPLAAAAGAYSSSLPPPPGRWSAPLESTYVYSTHRGAWRASSLCLDMTRARVEGQLLHAYLDEHFLREGAKKRRFTECGSLYK